MSPCTAGAVRCCQAWDTPGSLKGKTTLISELMVTLNNSLSWLVINRTLMLKQSSQNSEPFAWKKLRKDLHYEFGHGHRGTLRSPEGATDSTMKIPVVQKHLRATTPVLHVRTVQHNIDSDTDRTYLNVLNASLGRDACIFQIHI